MKFSFSFILSGLLAASAVVAEPIPRPVAQPEAQPAAQPAELATRIFGKARTPIDSASWAAISKYPAYSTAIYLSPFVKPCIPPFGSTLVKLINVSTTDTQMGIFRNDADKEFILGIPGANSTFDFFLIGNFYQVPYISPNVNCPFCHVHGGFLTSWNSVATLVETSLRALLATRPGYKVVISGHSLGGALCSLAYASLTGAKLPIKGGFCSGAPRVGDQFYANYIDKLSGASDTNLGNYYRATHYNDGVPQLPPLGSGYVHPRTEYFEAAYNTTFATTYRCYGQEAGDGNLSMGVNQGIPPAHETYAGVRYNCNNGYSPGPANPTDPY